MRVRNVEQDRPGEPRQREARKRTRDLLPVGHHGPDLEGGASRPAEDVTCDPLPTLGHERLPGRLSEEIGQHGRALHRAAGGIEGCDGREVRGHEGPDRAAGRRLGRRWGFEPQARDRINVTEAEREIDRPAEFCGVEAGDAARIARHRDGAAQEPRADAAPARILGDQHHADPASRMVAHADAAAFAQHEAPVIGGLIRQARRDACRETP